MKRLAIIGAGDLGTQLAHLARVTGGFEIAGFFDDTHCAATSAPILGGLRNIEAVHASGAFDTIVVGIGYKHLPFRHAIFERLVGNIEFATLIHPSAVIDPTCEIGCGSVIYPGCILDAGVTIGKNTLLNTGCVVAHDSRINDGCFLSPAVSVAGFANIMSSTILGIGTIVVDNVTISSGIRTGAGAVVVNDLSKPGLYVGIPAKFKKKLASQ